MTKATKTKSDSDGGKAALSGFLYQMLVALGLSGQATAELDDDDGISALLSLAKKSTVVHEGYDGDVALLREIDKTVKKGVVLVQCKFSKSGPVSGIAPKRFKEMLDRLDVAAKRARRDGLSATTFYLVTNRTYSPGTSAILKEIDKSGTSKRLNRGQNSVAKKLKKVSPSNSQYWEGQLAKFASQYGLLPQEYQNGKEWLLGRLLSKTGDTQCEISQKMLVECLTGATNGCRIDHPYIQNNIKAGLKWLGPLPQHKIIDRPGAESKFNLHLNRAIVLCVGQGGTGKTATLQKWAHREAETKFVAARRPASVTIDWVSSQINKWRSIDSPKDSADTAMSRLQISNPKMAPPLFLLCLDGIDERSIYGTNTQQLASVIEWFWDQDIRARQDPTIPVRARLIVSCRRKKDFEPFWLPNSSGIPSSAPEFPPQISFADFDDDEFTTILKANRDILNEKVFTRLLASTSGPIAADDAGFLFSGSTSRNPEGTNAPDRILRHPAMWQAFLNLSDNNMLGVLNGDGSAEKQLAGNYFRRFFEKANARSYEMEENTIRWAFMALAVATKSSASMAKHQRSLWYETLREKCGITFPQSDILFTEALSSGLVIGDNDQWVWRYSFVQSYLASGENSQ